MERSYNNNSYNNRDNGYSRGGGGYGGGGASYGGGGYGGGNGYQQDDRERGGNGQYSREPKDHYGEEYNTGTGQYTEKASNLPVSAPI